MTGGVSSLGLTSEAWDLVMEKDPHHPNHSRLPCGKHTESYGKSPYFIGKSNIYIYISIFNSYVELPEDIYNGHHHAINIFLYLLVFSKPFFSVSRTA